MKKTLFPEQIGVGAEAEANELELPVVDAVNQNKVRFDMAVAIASVFSLERMILQGWRKRLPGAKQINDRFDFSKIFATANRQFEVFCKRPFEN